MRVRRRSGDSCEKVDESASSGCKRMFVGVQCDVMHWVRSALADGRVQPSDLAQARMFLMLCGREDDAPSAALRG